MYTVINGAAVIFYFAFMAVLISKQRQISPLFIYIVIIQSWSLLSVFYNDLGIWNPELFSNTKASLATIGLAVALATFFSGFFWAEMRFKPPQLSSKPTVTLILNGQQRNAMIILIALAIGFFSANIIVRGDAFFVDRLAYLKSASIFEQLFLGFLPFVAFTLGYLRESTKGLALTDLCFLFLLLYLTMIGNKFSFLIIVFVAYVLGLRQVYTLKNAFRLINTKNVFLATLSVAIVVALALRQYEGQAGATLAAADLLTRRLFAYQGHVWWAVFNDITLFEPSQIKNEFKAAVFKDFILGDAGLSYLMVEILGWSRAYQLFENGYLYTMGFPAILLKISPWFSLPFLLFFIGTLGGIISIWQRSFVSNDRFPAALVAFSMLVPFSTFVLSGNAYVFFTIELLAKIILLFFVRNIQVKI